jgi:hypothetical protein
LKGHGFSRAAKAAKETRASAPDGMLDRNQDLFKGSLNEFSGVAMFDQLDDKEPVETNKRKRLPFWAMLLIWLVMGTGFTAYNWFLVRQDERIAPKEQVALASIYKSTDGKGGPRVFYSFLYDGEKYQGDDGVARGSILSNHVAVYLDPDDPATNTLTEYRFKEQEGS